MVFDALIMVYLVDCKPGHNVGTQVPLHHRIDSKKTFGCFEGAVRMTEDQVDIKTAVFGMSRQHIAVFVFLFEKLFENLIIFIKFAF
jgi:hypothetical protein